MSAPAPAAAAVRVRPLPPDALRPPAPLDPTAPAYKDWFHVNVFDHVGGTVGLLNVSLHGPPGDARSRAVGAALFDVPGSGWVGNLVVRAMDEAAIGTTSIGLDCIGLAVDHRTGTLSAAADLHGDRCRLRLTAKGSDALAVERPLPLGSGWISWYVAPRLQSTGSLRIGDASVPLDGASAYHDHNWGRWHWGDDFGWDWGSFATPPPGPTVVLARTADRSRRRPGPPTLLIVGEGFQRRFGGRTIQIRQQGRLAGPLRRLPGAMAALRPDRASPSLPAHVRVVADDGMDRVELDFTARSAAQLVLADPIRRGHSFVHESTGTFTLAARVGGADWHGSGLAVVEHVD